MDATYEPEIYDLTTPSTFRGDVDWYRRKARESGGPVLELSYLYATDITRLLGQAGFRSIEISGGFDGRPFQSDADELVVEATP